MSDYVFKKVVRIKIPEISYEELEYDVEEPFEVECAIDYNNEWKHEYYMDYVLEYSYGEHSQEFANVIDVSNEEYKYYIEKFDKYVKTEDINISDMKILVYSHYNCSECQSYFENGLYIDGKKIM